MTSKKEIKKEILYRSIHRGCKETDFLVGKFVEENLENISDTDTDLIREFIEEEDVLIYDWIMNRAECVDKYQDLVQNMQNFHGIKHK